MSDLSSKFLELLEGFAIQQLQYRQPGLTGRELRYLGLAPFTPLPLFTPLGNGWVFAFLMLATLLAPFMSQRTRQFFKSFWLSLWYVGTFICMLGAALAHHFLGPEHKFQINNFAVGVGVFSVLFYFLWIVVAMPMEGRSRNGA